MIDAALLSRYNPTVNVTLYTQQLWRNIEVSDEHPGCWLWQGDLCPEGHAQQNLGYMSLHVEGLIYQLLFGPIPQGMSLRHACVHQHCVKPEHMELDATPQEAACRPRRQEATWLANKRRGVNLAESNVIAKV